MTESWNNSACPMCGVGTLHDATRTKTVIYRGESFVDTYSGAYCDNCNESIAYHDSESEVKWKAFRDQIDRYQAAELLQIRQKLGLTQEAASGLTGGGHNAFSRYECNRAKPVMAVVNLFRLFDRHPYLLKEFGFEQPSFSCDAVVSVHIAAFFPVLKGFSLIDCVDFNAAPLGIYPKGADIVAGPFSPRVSGWRFSSDE
jgi:HTH-type transcriptional regulator/antitoxin MqsA